MPKIIKIHSLPIVHECRFFELRRAVQWQPRKSITYRIKIRIRITVGDSCCRLVLLQLADYRYELSRLVEVDPFNCLRATWMICPHFKVVGFGEFSCFWASRWGRSVQSSDKLQLPLGCWETQTQDAPKPTWWCQDGKLQLPESPNRRPGTPSSLPQL